MTPERLAEIQNAADTRNLDRRQLLAHRRELLAEVQRLTDELDSAGWSSDHSWTREVELVQENARLTALLATERN